MATDFPNSPANGATHTFGGTTYTYSTSVGAWTAGSSAGGASVTVSETAPSNPAEGDLWFDPSVLKTFVYYNDGSANQWVQSNPTGAGGSGGGGGGASVTASDTAPSSPSAGDLWYKSDTNALYVYYNDGDSSQWVGVSGPTGPTGATGATGGAGIASVYATIDNLPMTGNSAGDQAYVTANNTLYFWNGSGWYKIALINATPSISGVSSSYALARDGTATTVTITATDPEGLPITYSILSDTSGNTATVAQGSGASSNVFTITPSTNTAHAGTFSLTFRASDGVNIATAPATFTLQFSIENSKYTTGLFTSTGANAATNSTFTDASTNAVSFNVSNVYQTTFSPYRPGGYSTYFDGTTGTKLTTPAQFDFSGSFTAEFWFHTGNRIEIGSGKDVTPSDYDYFRLGTNGNGYAFFQCRSDSVTVTTATGSTLVNDNSWHHIAGVRDANGNMTLYVDGVSAATATNSGNLGTSETITIGAFDYESTGNDVWGTGYLRDVRISSNVRYSANFTAPTQALTSDSDTTLLTCHLPYIADGSTNGHTITPNGNVSVKPFTPYDSTEEYSAATHGGSLCGNANGELTGTLPSALGSGDFTIEGWFYAESFGSNTGVVTIGNHGANGIAILLENTGKFRIDLSTSYSNNSTSNVQLNTWNHFKVIRSSGTITAYLNGVQEQSFSNTLNITATNITIGGRGGLSGYKHEGNLADIKVTASAASDTTVPTSVVSSTNALFHLPFIEAGIIDKSQTAFNAILAGNTQSSTTQTKYLSSSMYFDGSGDYIEVSHDPVFNLRKDFTIECWAYFNSLSSSVLIEKYDNNNSASWELYWRSTGSSIAFYADATPLLQDPSTSTVTTGQWYHIAVSRTGSTVKLFIDGTEVDSATSSTAFTATVPMQLGRQRVNNSNQFNGYLSDVRITNGLGRYTANFTPPAAALQG